VLLFGIVTVIILLLDQLLKWWTVNNIPLNSSRELIPGVVQLSHVQNENVAFGLKIGPPWILYVLAVLAVALAVVIFFLLAKKKILGSLGRWAAVFMAAGALGNAIDRVVNGIRFGQGYVVDMIQVEFMHFATFNLADSFLTVGAILFCFYIIFHKSPDPLKTAQPGAATDRYSRGDSASEGYSSRGGRSAPGSDSRPNMPPREDPSQIHVGNIEQISKPDLEEMTGRLPKVGALKMAQDAARRQQQQQPARPRPTRDPYDQYAQGPGPRTEPVRTEAPQQGSPRQQDSRLYDFDAPQPSQAPQVQPRKKSADTDFSLDDILDEFRD